MRGFVGASDDAHRTTVIVGEGLIGREISDRLRRRHHRAEWHRRTDWDDPASPGKQLRSALSEHDQAVEPTDRIELIWAAGVSGMALRDLDLDQHLERFRTQVGGMIDACPSPPRVHYLSSAGALGPPGGTDRFEVGHIPYAHLKRGEEDELARLGVEHVVYRISSVYGTPRPGARSGAIGLLVENAIRGRETLLYARSTTMRNYAHARDVAVAIVRNSMLDSNEPVLLAAKRSHPMFEVIAQVGQLTRRPVPICYRPPSNDHDMVFDPKHVSPLLPERSLGSGIRLVVDGVLAG